VKGKAVRVRFFSTELNWADVLTEELVPKKHNDALEVIIDSKEPYRFAVKQKGVWVQYPDSYFLLATNVYLKTFNGLDIILEDRT
jgi:hypothetical protein